MGQQKYTLKNKINGILTDIIDERKFNSLYKRPQTQQVNTQTRLWALVHVLKTTIVYVHVPVMDEKRVQKSSLFGQKA